MTSAVETLASITATLVNNVNELNQKVTELTTQNAKLKKEKVRMTTDMEKLEDKFDELTERATYAETFASHLTTGTMRLALSLPSDKFVNEFVMTAALLGFSPRYRQGAVYFTFGFLPSDSKNAYGAFVTMDETRTTYIIGVYYNNGTHFHLDELGYVCKGKTFTDVSSIASEVKSLAENMPKMMTTERITAWEKRYDSVHDEQHVDQHVHHTTQQTATNDLS
jgi:hypothetical protein